MSGSVSVVIAAFNAAAFIQRAIDSTRDQPALREIIIVDDASTDGTSQVIKNLAAVDSRIKPILLTTNGGPATARNRGFVAASGDWVAVLDADDAFSPGRLARLQHFGAQNNLDIVADNVCYYNVHRGILSPPQVRVAKDQPCIVSLASYLAKARPFTGELDWGLLKPVFRRDYLVSTELRYQADCRHGEDFLLMIDALMAGARFAIDAEPGYYYTSRDSGLSRTQVNYPEMLDQTNDLLKHSIISRSRVYSRLVKARSSSIVRLMAHNEFDQAEQRGNLDAIIKVSLRHPRVLRRVADLLVKRAIQRRNASQAK